MCFKTEVEKNHEKGGVSKAARVRELFRKHRGLQEVGERYDWFQFLMTRVVENKLRYVRARERYNEAHELIPLLSCAQTCW